MTTRSIAVGLMLLVFSGCKMMTMNPLSVKTTDLPPSATAARTLPPADGFAPGYRQPPASTKPPVIPANRIPCPCSDPSCKK